MTVVLARIDDRLIHGQVTVGWRRYLEPQRILLCSNDVASDPWQAKVYASSVPPNMSVAIHDQRDTAVVLTAADSELCKTILLTATPNDMLQIIQAGVALPEINVGGMHFRKGKTELCEYVWLDRDDLVSLKSLLESGCRLYAQTVPGARESEITSEALAALEAQL